MKTTIYKAIAILLIMIFMIPVVLFIDYRISRHCIESVGVSLREGKTDNISNCFTKDAIINFHEMNLGFTDARRILATKIGDKSLKVVISDFHLLDDKNYNIFNNTFVITTYFVIEGHSLEASGKMELKRTGLWQWKVIKWESDSDPFGNIFFNSPTAIISESITENDQQLGVLKLRMSLEQVNKLMLEKPIKVESNKGKRQSGDPFWETWEYRDGTRIHFFSEDKENMLDVFSITVRSAKYPTPRGLKVGDSLVRLKALYGNYGMRYGNRIIYYYADKPDIQAMRVELDDRDKIIQIEVMLTM